MEDIIKQLQAKNWDEIAENLHTKGFSIVENVLNTSQCEALKGLYAADNMYRKTVIMERYRFGIGEYKYFRYPLPQLITDIRETVYPYLAKVANKWMEILNIATTFPLIHEELKLQCHQAGQTKPTILILKYGKGGFNTLHQDLYGDIYFPIQLVLFLNEPDQDFTGGEFVMTEQIPRAQSKAIVLKPKKGDMLLFTTNFRPVKGSKGYYRVNMKHGVSELHSGNRHTLGIIFHDALS
ncbi:hypothetical protein ABIE26_004074 [Pedobacter africanus]|uniref:Uncharacterized protein n=1 Tax=Pedobacter africanus TaxID=151894 RepID=A0ACC6L187_9SPHI|nr:2OG-Fe(II) oxygenase [Pedobacter africanus]MDR6785364.1 hypothetical protein [Pedobacter africanus]